MAGEQATWALSRWKESCYQCLLTYCSANKSKNKKDNSSGISTSTDKILPGLNTKYFSLASFAITDPKRSEIHKAKRLVRGKNSIESFHCQRQCRSIFKIEQILIQKGVGVQQYNICTLIAYRFRCAGYAGKYQCFQLHFIL